MCRQNILVPLLLSNYVCDTTNNTAAVIVNRGSYDDAPDGGLSLPKAPKRRSTLFANRGCYNDAPDGDDDHHHHHHQEKEQEESHRLASLTVSSSTFARKCPRPAGVASVIHEYGYSAVTTCVIQSFTSMTYTRSTRSRKRLF